MASEEREQVNSSNEIQVGPESRLGATTYVRPGIKPRTYPPRNGASTNGPLTEDGAMGWFGIGLGLAELLAPRRVATMIGVSPEHRTLIRLMGLRELVSSAGILSDRSSAGAVWSRVAGDVLDVALLGAAFTSNRSDRGRLAAVAASVARRHGDGCHYRATVEPRDPNQKRNDPGYNSPHYRSTTRRVVRLLASTQPFADIHETRAAYRAEG